MAGYDVWQACVSCGVLQLLFSVIRPLPQFGGERQAAGSPSPASIEHLGRISAFLILMRVCGMLVAPSICLVDE